MKSGPEMEPLVRAALVLFIALMIGAIVLYHKLLDRAERRPDREAARPAPGGRPPETPPLRPRAALGGDARESPRSSRRGASP